MHFKIDPSEWLKDLFIQSGLSLSLSTLLSAVSLIAGVFFISWLANLITKAVILKVVTRIVKKTTSTWDDIFLEQKVFTRMSHFAPALVIWYMAGWALESYPIWLAIIHRLTYVYIVLIGMIVTNSFIEAWHKIYNTLPISKHRHIKGYVQLVKIFVILIAILIIVSVIFKKDITSILAGLGAIAAVLILVFKDSLLGLVASIQLSADKMLSVGDWITIPAREVDGVVTDITLNTVIVQNFDKTIITIPAYSLVNESFQNWKGMTESGVRRIRRAIFIDMRSIKFLDAGMKEKFSKYPDIKKFIEDTRKENLTVAEKADKDSPFFNPVLLTNLGLFRFYMESYLRNHIYIDPEQALILRHRDPVGNGLPLQVLAFTRNNLLTPYENIQSQIFEHLLAILGEFDLKVYQQPTGDDILVLSNLYETDKN